jgi:hypothetical protein
MWIELFNEIEELKTL